MIRKILRLFFKTFTADAKDYLLNRDNLGELIQMQISQKQKTFSEFFLAFLKSILNFKHLPKKTNLIADAFPEVPFPKNVVR